MGSSTIEAASPSRPIAPATLTSSSWGYEVVRFTYRQVNEEPSRVAAALRMLLRRPAGAL
jgi:very-short-patch-repair endonuclease